MEVKKKKKGGRRGGSQRESGKVEEQGSNQASAKLKRSGDRVRNREVDKVSLNIMEVRRCEM